MPDYAEYTRRGLIRLGASLVLTSAVDSLYAAEHSALPVQFTPERMTEGSKWSYREYAVHATVMVGSIPIISKKNVGGAAFALEQAAQDEAVWTALQFVAGSWPEHLKGFNRFGATQELVRESKRGVSESGYVSFMATSRETGFSEASKAFSTRSESQMFTFARGRATETGCSYQLQRKSFPAKYTWSNCVEMLKETGDSGLPTEQAVAGYGTRCLPTFLYAVREAIRQAGENTESSYMHNGKVYRLRTESKADANAGLRVITGKTAAEHEHGTEFKVWVDLHDESALPAKIEFRPRGFLKLTLERGEALRASSLHPILRRTEG